MGDSGYLQRVPLVRLTLGANTRFGVHPASGPAESVLGLRPLIDVGPDMTAPRTTADGPMVFAGYGVPRPGGGDDLARVPVEGRVVVVVNGAPSGADAGLRAELESPAAIGVRLQRILPLHPAAVIVLLTGSSADYYASLGRVLAHGTLVSPADTSPGRAAVALQLPAAQQPPNPSPGTPAVAADFRRVTPMLLVGIPLRGSPLLPARWPRDDRPQILHDRRFTGSVEVTRTPVEGYNVLAGVPGHDPAVGGSWVAFGAHLDHLGILPVTSGDSVAHGADDDGSGTVALLAVARAMEQGPPPRRSVLFIWHTAEAEGLLGSEYFTAHPTVPLDSLVALINVDMVGRNAPESLFVVGPRAAPHAQSEAVGRVVDSVNASLPVPFHFDRDWDTAAGAEGIYQRNDSYLYAERGVPIVFFTSGLHADYHRVTDNASRIDYQKLAHVGQLLLRLGESLANLEVRPR